MEIDYKSDKLEKECQSLKIAQKKYGKYIAEKLMALIQRIECSEFLRELQRPYNLHPLTSERKGQHALDIAGRASQYRLIIKPLTSERKEWEKELSIIYKETNIVLVWEVSKHYE